MGRDTCDAGAASPELRTGLWALIHHVQARVLTRAARFPCLRDLNKGSTLDLIPGSELTEAQSIVARYHSLLANNFDDGDTRP